MSGLSLSSSSSGTSSSSSDSSASSGSSTPSTSGRLSLLPEADEHSPIDGRISSVPDLVGHLSPRCLGVEPNEAGARHPSAFDDIMLLFETDEVEAEGGVAEEAARWLLVDVDNGRDDEKGRCEADECQPVAHGEFFEYREKERAEVGQLSVEGLGVGFGPSEAEETEGVEAVDYQMEVRERERSYGGGAEENGESEVERNEKSEAEGTGGVEAEGRDEGEAEESGAEDGEAEDGEAENGEAEKRRKNGAKEKRKNEAEERDRVEGRSWADRDWAEVLQLGDVGALRKNEGEGKLGFSETEGGEAERLQARARAVNLVESLGLGGSDSEEGGLCVSNFGAKEPLALMAVESQSAVGYESGCGVDKDFAVYPNQD